MSRKKLKARDKITLKMSRNGAVEQNLTRGEDIRISKRVEDFQFSGQKNKESFSQLGKSQQSNHKKQKRYIRHKPLHNSTVIASEELISPTEKSDLPMQVDNISQQPVIHSKDVDFTEKLTSDINTPLQPSKSQNIKTEQNNIRVEDEIKQNKSVPQTSLIDKKSNLSLETKSNPHLHFNEVSQLKSTLDVQTESSVEKPSQNLSSLRKNSVLTETATSPTQKTHHNNLRMVKLHRYDRKI